MDVNKKTLLEFWENASCGESLYLKGDTREYYEQQAEIRYQLEPFIRDFTEFHRYGGKKVLEIGVGLGADHQKFAESGAQLYGIDLTERAIRHTRRRFQVCGLSSQLAVADAENLPFGDGTFDLVYSWGVLHHTPQTERAIHEVFRVLKGGGEAKIMIYHKYSFVGYMLWLWYALARLRFTASLYDVYRDYLESPGTKAYSRAEARELFHKFREVTIETVLTHGDLLTSSVGQRHRGIALSIARAIWPRWIIRTFFPRHGLFMLITGRKP